MAFRVIVSEAVCADVGAACLSNGRLPAPLVLMYVCECVDYCVCVCLCKDRSSSPAVPNLTERQRFIDKIKSSSSESG